MLQQQHALVAQTFTAQREISSLHFGPRGQGKKIYLQAGLHADEHPGILVLHHLKQRLQTLEAQHRLTGEVVLVPIANPIGLDNFVFGRQLGRFELSSRENFNRHYPDLAKLIEAQVVGALNDDADHNVQLIRRCLNQALQETVPSTELESLRLTLMRLACDADYVLDIHCDSEAMLHLYVHSRQQEQARVLAAHTGANAILHATVQGGNSFDETFTSVWHTLQQRFPQYPIPMATFAATLELRGIQDVSHELAIKDAEALLAYLVQLGIVLGEPSEPPPLMCEPTPLAGVEVLQAPHAGIVVYRAAVGSRVEVGTALVDIIDPITDRTSTLHSTITGMFYARETERFTQTNAELTFVAGAQVLRQGCLLGA